MKIICKSHTEEHKSEGDTGCPIIRLTLLSYEYDNLIEARTMGHSVTATMIPWTDAELSGLSGQCSTSLQTSSANQTFNKK